MTMRDPLREAEIHEHDEPHVAILYGLLRIAEQLERIADHFAPQPAQEELVIVRGKKKKE